MEHFRYWCYKVLPLVYDQSLSYYEVVCKVVDYINKLIDQDKIFGKELDALQKELNTVQQWIDNFDYPRIENTIKEYIKEFIATMIIVTLSDNGYIVYYIPEEWEDIVFKTSGLDIIIDGLDYGHLILLY